MRVFSLRNTYIRKKSNYSSIYTYTHPRQVFTNEKMYTTYRKRYPTPQDEKTTTSKFCVTCEGLVANKWLYLDPEPIGSGEAALVTQGLLHGGAELVSV